MKGGIVENVDGYSMKSKTPKNTDETNIPELPTEIRHLLLRRIRAHRKVWPDPGLTCGHEFTPETCVKCAYSYGRSIGHLECGAYYTGEEIFEEDSEFFVGKQKAE